MTGIHFITFANTSSGFSTERIEFECKEMGLFDSVDCYSEKDIDDGYMKKYGTHFNEKRGYGYWSWKPYFLKRKLSEIEDGECVVYADCGCMLLPSNKGRLLEWVMRAKESECGVLSPCYGPYLEHDWTRGDLYEYIEKTYNKDGVDIFEDAVQCGCGVLVVCKKAKSVEFIDAFNDVMSNHFELCTDAKSSVPNHKGFRENRHDQSVFSMLSKIYGIETIDTKNGILDKKNSPIICTRCKNDKGVWKRPLTVLFDSQTFDLQQFGGISKMYVEVSKVLNRNEIVENFTGSGYARGKYQDTYAKFSAVRTNNQYLMELGCCSGGNENNVQNSIRMLEEGDFDIFYPTFFNPYFIDKLRGKPFVMSVHDMIPELYPQFFSQRDLQIIGKRIMVPQAAAIEVPTNTTKNDLIRILGVPEEKIHVIGRGLSENFGMSISNAPLVNFKYILYVGHRNAYKRFDWFVKHVKSFLDSKKDVNVVCTGPKFTAREENMINAAGLGRRFFHAYVNDKHLANLYKHAECFVYSSEYEGFGLPILEAYKMGCPTLLNDTACFREVTFGEGEYFNMTENESNLSERLEQVTSMGVDKAMRIRERLLETYTWQKCASKLNEVFKKVCNGKQ